MGHDEFLSWPEEVQTLIDDIGTIEGLDVMCFVARDPFAAWRVEQLSDELALDRMGLEDAIRRLVVKGMLEGMSDGRLRITSATAMRTGTLTALAQLCEQDRANVLGAIAHYSISRIRTSAVRTFVRKTADRDDP